MASGWRVEGLGEATSGAGEHDLWAEIVTRLLPDAQTSANLSDG
jgi:hypothetical protein